MINNNYLKEYILSVIFLNKLLEISDDPILILGNPTWGPDTKVDNTLT